MVLKMPDFEKEISTIKADATMSRRIFWKCRRGMLELDLMLQKFFHQQFSYLSLEQQINFDYLLDEQDFILFGWILGNTCFKSPPSQWESLIKLIKMSSGSGPVGTLKP